CPSSSGGCCAGRPRWTSDPSVDHRIRSTAMTISPTTTTTDASIELSGVSVDFPDPAGGTKRVLTDIDLSVPAGQFIALVGRSGCGKTTLLNMMAALVQPTSGSVTVAGREPRAARDRL